jgi:SAM-dependent methyltransferase
MVMDQSTHAACRVCLGGARPFMTVQGRRYWRCRRCRATQLDARQLPDPGTERRHYLTHHNDPADEGYRRFLARLASPLLKVLDRASEGLDFGCGPGPALAAMLEAAGHRVRLHDPFFRPDPAALERCYDFVTLTEVAEHLHRPHAVFRQLAGLIRPGGRLAVMTALGIDDRRFANWRYRRDPTHVVFYRAATFRYLASSLGLDCRRVAPDVVLLRKPGSGRSSPTAPVAAASGARCPASTTETARARA